MSLSRSMSLMALAALPGLGPVSIRKLDRAMGGRVEELLEMDSAQRANWCSPRVVEELAELDKYFEPERVTAELRRLHADFLTAEDVGYPKRLAPYADRPVGLYRMHAEACLGTRVIAIVGTRLPSAYGRRVARQFAESLCGRGFTIVSGLAEGIDTEAHRTALHAGGQTAAVLGGGLNRCYPSSNRGLMEEIATSAGVWTEFPLWRSADRRSFPQRNRIVSAVSQAVLVIESGDKGGSLITARMAAEQGKPVYVIPGRIDSPESAGCLSLIRDGAQLVTRPEDILEDLDCLPENLDVLNSPGRGIRSAQRSCVEPALDGLQASVWEYLGEHEQAHVDAMAGALDRSAPEIAMAVLEMEMAGHVSRRLDGCYERA